MDYSRALGAEFREVRDTVYEGQPARVVVGSRLYATDPSDLWDALTNVERIPRWLLPISGELRIGGRYQLETNASGTITRCDPPAALGVTWEYDGNVSWVSVLLSAEHAGTRLTLEHTMLKDKAAEEHWEKYGPGATGVGWDLAHLGMALHLDSGGEAIDREANDAWMASEHGKAFIRGCAEAWNQAHVAAGEDPDVARAMAAQTAQAYAGE